MSSKEDEPVPEPGSASSGVGTDVPSPFESEPRKLPITGKGCSRMAIAGCGLLALVIGLAVLTMLLKASDLVSWSLAQIRAEVEQALPVELPLEERERLGEAFDAAIARVESGDLDAVAFQQLQAELLRFARRREPASVDEVRALSEALERFAGIDPHTLDTEPSAVS